MKKTNSKLQLFRMSFDLFYRSKAVSFPVKVLFLPLYFPCYIVYFSVKKFFMERRIILEKMDLHICSKCTLNCKYCSSMISFFKNPGIFPKKEILFDFAAIEKYVDRFDTVNLIGGEPLLHPDLPEIIEALTKYKKVKKITVVTNGTICPSPELIQSLKNKKVYVVISNYFPLSKELNRILPLFRSENILFDLQTSFFNDYGRRGRLNRSIDEMEYAFSNCLETLCRTLLHGKLYLCPASAQMAELGLVTPAEDDFLDIRNHCHGEFKTIKKKLKILLNKNSLPLPAQKGFTPPVINHKRFVTACDWCIGHYPDQEVRKAAEQLPMDKYIDGTDFSLKNR